MNDSTNTVRPRAITAHVTLLEGSTNGARTARLPSSTCRVTVAEHGPTNRLLELVATLADGGVMITWERERAEPGEVDIRPVYDVREVLADREGPVAVISNEYDLLAPPVYEAVADVLKGQTPRPSPQHYDALGVEIAQSARILLGVLAVPGFEQR
jgi:hypothetical protein